MEWFDALRVEIEKYVDLKKNLFETGGGVRLLLQE